MTADAPARILCVDDEPRILDVFTLFLSPKFDVVVATSGREGLTVLQNQGPFAVVLSDLRMPGMNGVTFLGRVRQLAPDTVRLLLTGDTVPENSIAEINEGDLFRCLEKPCSVDHLIKTVEAAADQYRLTIQERLPIEQERPSTGIPK